MSHIYSPVGTVPLSSLDVAYGTMMEAIEMMIKEGTLDSRDLAKFQLVFQRTNALMEVKLEPHD